jgi:hypothetical protein
MGEGGGWGGLQKHAGRADRTIGRGRWRVGSRRRPDLVWDAQAGGEEVWWCAAVGGFVMQAFAGGVGFLSEEAVITRSG